MSAARGLWMLRRSRLPLTGSIGNLLIHHLTLARVRRSHRPALAPDFSDSCELRSVLNYQPGSRRFSSPLCICLVADSALWIPRCDRLRDLDFQVSNQV